jgi:hypothetical protein
MADRESVSGDAHKVWMYYMHRRPDVTVHQLDTTDEPHLTASTADDCSQVSAMKWADKDNLVHVLGATRTHHDAWANAPESKRITKDKPTTLRALALAGRLVMSPKQQASRFKIDSEHVQES